MSEKKFKPGDKIVRISDSKLYLSMKEGQIYTFETYVFSNSNYGIYLRETGDECWDENKFELATPYLNEQKLKAALGIS